MPNVTKPARYWILTIPQHCYTPYLPDGVQWIKGQLESGSSTGYLHWQLAISLPTAARLSRVVQIFGRESHAEPSRSAAVDEYVWKEDTRIEGTQFELGRKLLKRSSQKDWETIWNDAKNGSIDGIPADVRVMHYRTIRAIQKDYLKPQALEKEVFVFWGRTGTGKSKRAWEEASLNAYPKDPNTKYWDAYQEQEHVVIDEFRGKIDISHMLRWLDRYPVTVECKFGAVCLRAKKIWITSNMDPRNWYPELDQETVAALLRRMNITQFL